MSVSDVQDRSISSSPHPAGSMQSSYQIVPNDTKDIDPLPRVVYIGVAGDVHYVMINGHERTRSLPAGYHPLQMKKIFATGTTASEIEGHY